MPQKALVNRNKMKCKPGEMYNKYQKTKNKMKKKTKKKLFTKIAMSKPVGKVLDSKVGKAGVAVGNKIIKGVKRLKPDMKKIREDLVGSPAIDKRQREEGAKMNAEYSGRYKKSKKKMKKGKKTIKKNKKK